MDRLLGRLRFTCAHELGHWVLHQKLYFGTGDVAAYEGKTSLDESYGLVEWQADALATALLMPLPQIKRSFYRLRAGRSHEHLVAEMARIFQVSKQAMRIRLETRNLISVWYGKAPPPERGAQPLRCSQALLYAFCSQLSEQGSATVQKCKRQMATLGFDSQLAYHRVKLILKIYRDVVWVLSERMEELHEYAWELGAQDADTGLIYLQSFAPDMDLQEFEERVCCVMENRMLVDVIDRALLRLKRYPDRGELYYEILTKQFIHRFNSTEKELLDELNMERSVFYDRKREAIFLLSLCLFGYAVPELQEELEMPRLYPD